MRKTTAAIGSAAFFVLAPGVVAGVLPWWITGGAAGGRLPAGARAVGAVLVAGSAAVLLSTFARFVAAGGTPAPIAPTERLVVRGAYRHVRNPMYLAVVAAILGQALWLAQPVLLAYAAVAWASMAAFARWHEEPALRARFGAEFEAYRRAVPAWWPRLRPWRPASR